MLMRFGQQYFRYMSLLSHGFCMMDLYIFHEHPWKSQFNVMSQCRLWRSCVMPSPYVGREWPNIDSQGCRGFDHPPPFTGNGRYKAGSDIVVQGEQGRAGWQTHHWHHLKGLKWTWSFHATQLIQPRVTQGSEFYLITSGTARVWVRSGDDEQEYVLSSINRDHITITSFLHKNTIFFLWHISCMKIHMASCILLTGYL